MSSGNSKKLKSIAFDLDTKALKENYTKGDWHNAYNDINPVMIDYTLQLKDKFFNESLTFQKKKAKSIKTSKKTEQKIQSFSQGFLR
ncbi:hypothetical protein [Campylobacter upsaliensis]|uniref:Uncharacterized protein n=1 Tax=Campylobacter upsaliensis TaxID=28080 RepID=A0A381EHF0_CAMUP|nr:hypothetical protein [Campylobacter upsaliensis]SUX26350.1 Uncharacterised protein [Campylobacter upsaliensis]SUX26738.1 Uncharacterised protein [Campylobacter upsaliensis]